MTPPLAPTIVERDGELRDCLNGLRRGRIRAVQLSASGPRGLRPRSMSASARRDLGATLRRLEIRPAGIDLWIPPDHFSSEVEVERAIDAVEATCVLAADLDRCPVTIELPEPVPDDEALDALSAISSRLGIVLADAGCPGRTPPAGFHACVDAAAWLAAGLDPVLPAAARETVVRFSDFAGSTRVVPGCSGGSLDVVAFRAACDVAAPERPVVADLRFLANPGSALVTMRTAWGEIPEGGTLGG